MKQELHPAALVGIIVVVVALLVVFGSRMLQPASYEPSPGVVGTKGSAPGSKLRQAAMARTPLTDALALPEGNRICRGPSHFPQPIALPAEWSIRRVQPYPARE